MATTTLNHPNLGKIKGNAKDEVNQYLGIKYGQLSDRFAEATLYEPPSGSELDATRIGPAVLSPPDAVEMEQGLIQHTLPYPDRRTSDLDGLVLSVTVPKDVDTSKKLPVFMFVHGGGFFIGCGSWPVYDGARIVELSARKGTPVIGVTINYRVGAPGFLTSAEMRSAGYKANNGLRDQRLAIQWIKEHIAGFGGDAEELTLIGQSAGSASVAFHLQAEERLFKRAFLMSGSDILLAAKPLDEAEGSYSTVLKLLDTDASSLASIPGQDLLSKIPPSVSMGVTIDGELIKARSTFDHVESATNKWCESVVVGDCAFDGNIIFLSLGHRKSGISKALHDSLHRSLPSHADALCNVYNISPSTPDDQGFLSALRFANDLLFYAPTTTYAAAFAPSKKVYVYRFNEPNPWPGQWHGTANHCLDVALFFQNYNEFLDDKQRASAEGWAERFIKFVNGQEPWQAWKKGSETALVIENGVLETKPDLPKETGRNEAFVELAEKIGLEELKKAWTAFSSGA